MQASEAEPEVYAYWRDRIGILMLGTPAEKNAGPPLNVAIREKAFHVVSFMLDHDADPNCEDNHYGHLDLAVFCIEKGADIHAKSDWGWTPLLHAVKNGYAEIARLLISKGADLNDRTDQGWTPLQIMVWDSNAEMVRLLLDHGADVKLALPDGRTALVIAQERGFGSIERMLLRSELRADHDS